MGKLIGIIGPMFAGKTTELLRRIKRDIIAKRNYGLFKPNLDNRYSNEHVVSHDKEKIKSIVITNSEEILNYNFDIYYFDELQFFDSKIIDVIEKLLKNDKTVVYTALNVTSENEIFPFRDNKTKISDLIAKPHEEIINLKAVCAICGNDNAIFTKYIGLENKNSAIKVGGKEKYIAVCRNCYYK